MVDKEFMFLLVEKKWKGDWVGVSGYMMKKIIPVFLIIVMIATLFSGCSKSGVSAQVDDKLELAVKYLSEQKYQEAILAYQDVIKIDSKNIISYKGISLAYALQNQPEQAAQILQEGLKVVPNDVQLQLTMAGILMDQGKKNQAESIYKELINGTNPVLASFQAFASFLNQQGRTSEAVTMLEQATEKNSSDYQMNVLLANLYYQSGKDDQAMMTINRSLAAQPEQSAAYKLIGEIYRGNPTDLAALGDQYLSQGQTKTGQILKMSALLKAGRNAEIVKLYGALTGDLKESVRIRYLVAGAYDGLGQKEQALEFIKSIKSVNIKDAGLLADIAAYYLEHGDKENARKIAMQGIQADLSLADNYGILYRSYIDQDDSMAKYWSTRYLLASNLSLKQVLKDIDLTTAQAYVERAIEITSQNVSRSIEGYTPALELYAKALKLVPDYYLAYTNRARTYNFMLQWDKGIADCNKAIEIAPSTSDAYEIRAWALNNGLSDYSRARDDAVKAIALGHDVAALHQLAVAYRGMRQYDKAIETANSGLAINPEYGWFYHDLGWSYMQLRQYESAKQYFLKATEFADTKTSAEKGLDSLAKMGY